MSFSDGDFTIFGDFSPEERGEIGEGNEWKRAATIPMIIRGLLNEDCAMQIRVSKEYSDRHSFYDRVTSSIKAITCKHKMFSKWKNYHLYRWQYQVLEMIMRQSSRNVLWVVDRQGNNGKTFLAMYLTVLYSFQYLDGVINGRDIGLILNSTSKGVVFDVARSAITNFDYSVVESIKTVSYTHLTLPTKRIV